MAELRGKIARLLDICLSMDIDKSTYEAKHSELQNALSTNERELSALKKLVESITYNEDKTVTIAYKAPFRHFIRPEVVALKNESDPRRFYILMRPLGESNPCCGNENPES